MDGIQYLKATEPQRGDNLLFTFKLPSMIIKFLKILAINQKLY